MEQAVGPGGIGVQIDGDGNSVTLYAGAARLVLDRPQARRARPRNERELLLTDRRATDLVGRDGDLAALMTWLAAPPPIACRCITARAGTGKTRLGIELCEQAEAAGWTAGFARREELERFEREENLAGWRWDRPVLVVVDYAAASGTVLRRWLEVLARRPAPQQPLRLLLLERHADAEAGWWHELARPAGLSGDGPDALLDPGGPIPLPSLARFEDRRALLAQAMREAARLRGIDPAPQPPAAGSDPAFERRIGDDAVGNEPLYLAMAGLMAIDTGALEALSRRRIELAIRIADAELSRLARIAAGRGIEPGLFRHIAACATLQGGCTRDAAARLVKEERADLGDRSTLSTGQLVAALADALPLPGTGDVDAVRPDLIGEALVWRHMTADRRGMDAQAAILHRAFARAGMPVVTTVIRAAQDLADGDAGHEAVTWLGWLADGTDDVNALTLIAEALPKSTLALREQAERIASAIADRRRSEASLRPDRLPSLAIALNNLSVRLSDLGRWEAALAVIEEAVGLYRVLAAAQPDAFRPDLAMSLSNLSNHLSDLGQREAALTASEEAVAIRRKLAASRPDTFQSALAGSLNNLSNQMADLGQREAALAVIEEAAGLYRTLAAALPDAFRPNLAMSLNNLSIQLSAVGRREAALVAIEQAVAILLALAETRPDAFRSDHAISLNNLSLRLADLGRREEALAAIKQAVAIHRALVVAQPDVFRPALAAPLNNLSLRLADLGHGEAALAAIEEATAICRELAVARPDVFRPALAASLNNLSLCLSDLGRREAALAAIEEAVAIRRERVAARPDAFRPDLARSLMVLASRLDESDDRPGGLAANVEALGVLAPAFLRLPRAFAGMMADMLEEYRERCATLRREPDHTLLAPIEEALNTLNSNDGGT